MAYSSFARRIIAGQHRRRAMPPAPLSSLAVEELLVVFYILSVENITRPKPPSKSPAACIKRRLKLRWRRGRGELVSPLATRPTVNAKGVAGVASIDVA